jgi:hypothetical protein
VFGGRTITATDCAVADGIAEIGDKALAKVPPALAAAPTGHPLDVEVHCRIERADMAGMHYDRSPAARSRSTWVVVQESRRN